ncbi:hypothetical protein TRAPUB_12678 [Trametes pubescens]|uniref:Uncharacterized protein n=1 Tax=Trametes pubescens TaxID=154538 RepID=A0A1M2VT72_TRAPU|nr:hypothetical protein TRAPUB_12678 [Trametes pubescens]
MFSMIFQTKKIIVLRSASSFATVEGPSPPTSRFRDSKAIVDFAFKKHTDRDRRIVMPLLIEIVR